MQKFYTAKNRLTDYALACGYVERKADGSCIVSLWKEHGVYHVRSYNHETGKRQYWESFNSLISARHHYDHSRALVLAAQSPHID